MKKNNCNDNFFENAINKIKEKQCLYLMGPTGPKGPTGPAGSSVTILGSYDNYDDFVKEHPVGKEGESYLVGNELYIWNPEQGTWVDVGNIKGPKGEQGERGPIGPTGPAGLSYCRSAYVVTFNDGTSKDGVAILPNEKLPLRRNEIDISNLLTLDSDILKFNEAGYYKIIINVLARISLDGKEFDPNVHFVSIGLREVGTDNVYIGASKWFNNEISDQIIAQGILVVANPNNRYELVNLSKGTIYLDGPDLINTISPSYFASSYITLTVEYLGRQY